MTVSANETRAKRKTIQRIRDAVCDGILEEPFSPREINNVLGIRWGGTFLPKHRAGNPGGNTELFVRVNRRPALYRLTSNGTVPGTAVL